MGSGATLVLFAGPPGTGKSSLAEVAAGELGAAVLAWDWVMAGLTGFDEVQAALRALPRHEFHRVGWSMLWNLATAQLRHGRSVVLDGAARPPFVAGTRECARDAGARSLVVATSCRDTALHRSRVEGRVRAIPGWYELDWDHVATVSRAWEPADDADLSLDAAEPWERNTDRLLALIRRA